jgi:hypothetical protein
MNVGTVTVIEEIDGVALDRLHIEALVEITR